MRIDFVANATHELRTPLTAIKGFGETLAMDAEEKKPTSLEFVHAINRNADRLTHLMNDLLDLSSLESGEVLRKEWVVTSELTRRMLRNLEGGFTARDQRLRTSYVAHSVYADPARLEQVLVNLLDNANKYAPVGAEILIEWTETEKDVALRVWNSGPGIPVEHQPRLFERFYRVDKARSREQGGTGLGLAIVKHILQRHEGTVSVDSVPDRGAAFVCRFPKEKGGKHREEVLA
jgi:two-component system phosphate regulon sensor histidine kinase PhoR